MVAVEVGYEDLFDLAELDVRGGGAEALDLVLGGLADVDEEGGGGGEDDSQGGLVARGGGDGGGGAEGDYGYGGRHSFFFPFLFPFL